MLEEFLKKYEGRPASAKFASLLSNFFAFCEEEGKTPRDFDEAEVRAYLLTERASLAPSTKKQILQAIRNFTRWFYAHKTELDDEARQRLRKARIEQITLPPEAKNHSRKALTLKELEKLLETAKLMGDNDFSVMYLLAYFGLRKGELESLNREAVDWNDRCVEVLTGKRKTPRILYFDKKAGGILMLALENDWTSLGWRQVKEYKSLFSGINFSLHCLRHTFNTHMRRRLENDSLLRALMGHSDKSMTDYYDSQFREEIKEAMLDNHYFSHIKTP